MISMENSTGALGQAYDEYLNSVQAHIDRFKAAYQSLAQTVTDSSLIKGLVDAGTFLITILDKLISALDKVGGVAPIIATFFGTIVGKNASKIFNFSGIPTFVTGLKEIISAGGGVAGVFTTMGSSAAAMSTGIGIAAGALALIIAFIASVKQHAEELRQATVQSGNDFNNSLSSRQASTEQYAARITELKAKIDEGTLSQEELYSVQSELLSIQDELSDTYGREADKLNLLTMSAGEAADAIEELNSGLTKREASAYLTQNSSQIDKAIAQVEKVQSFISNGLSNQSLINSATTLENTYSDVWERVQDIIGKYDAAGIGTTWIDAGGTGGPEKYYTLEVTANAKDAEATIYGLSQELQDLKNELAQEGINLDSIFNFEPILQKGLTKVDKILDDWESIYDTAQKAKIANNDVYNEIVRQYQDAERAYKEAITGNYDTAEERFEAIRAALEQMDIAKALFDNTTFSAEDAGVEQFIRDLFDAFEEASAGEELKLNFKLDITSGEKRGEMLSDIYDALKEFADDAGEFSKVSIDLAGQEVAAAHGVTEGLSEEALAYMNLDEVASQYGMTVSDLLTMMSDLGYLHFETAEGINAEIASLTTLSDELEGATRSLTEYNAALAGGEKGDIASQYASAYKSFIDDWEAGRTGTNKVQAAVELFIPEEVLRSLDYDIQAAGELLSSDMYRAIFSTDGDPGANFANYIRETYGNALDGIVEITENGDSFDIAIASYQALADALGMDINVVHALCDALDAYGVQVMMSAEDTRALAEGLGILDASMSNLEKIQAAIDGLADKGNSVTQIKQIIDQLAAAGYIDTSGIEGLGNMIAEAVQKVAEADEQEATPTITLNKEQFDSGIADANRELTALGSRSETATVTTVHIDEYQTKNSGGFFSKLFGGNASAGGTNNAPGGKTLVNELGPELISENGQAYIAGGGEPTVVDLSPGAIVLDAETTKKALRGKAKAAPQIGAMATGSVFGAALGAALGAVKGVGSAIKTAVQKITTTTTTTVKTSAPAVGAVSGVLPTASGAAKLSSNATVPVSSGYSSGSSGSYSSGSGSGSGSSSSSAAAEKEETWFEQQYAEHNHLLKMDKESQEDYLNWLDSAYKQAYNEGIIDLKEYRQREEEVYSGRQSSFKDHLSDTEHMINMEKNGDNNPTIILNMYQQLLNDIQNELNNAYANGLDANNDYVQYLQNQWYKYYDDMKDAQSDATDKAEKQVKDLVDYRIKMLKQYLKNEISSLEERLSYLKNFYSKQKEMLQDVYDTESYLAEQSEKRKNVSDIQNELQALEFDDSAWAQKRKLQLKQELDEAQKELDDFERQHALSAAQEQLDAAYDIQEAAINARIDQLNDKLEDPQYLYETALRDVQNNSIALYEEMIDFNNKYGSGIKQDIVDMWEEAYVSLKKYSELYGELYKGISLVNATGYVPDSSYASLQIARTGYASGTSSATPGLHRVDELGAEYVFTSSNGNRYRMLSSGDKVLNSKATEFLYNFATAGSKVIPNMIANSLSDASGFADKSGIIGEINMGDIIIQGNADERTVSEIRRAQRENVDFILKEFSRLKK